MKITRRLFALLLILSAAETVRLPAQDNQKAAAKGQYLAYVGTYTSKTASKGIYAFRYGANSGKLTPIGVAAETPNPSWVVIHPNGKYAYAANESGKQSTITAFAIDAKSAKLTQLNQVPALGEDPCYLSFDKTGKYLFVANYTSGNVAAFPIGADGKLGSATANVRDEGKPGPNRERQEAPHAHWIKNLSGEVFVADLGLDRVLVYWFDGSKGTLALRPAPDANYPFMQKALTLKPGTGPRHVVFSVFSRSGHLMWSMYVLGELDSTITRFVATKEGFLTAHSEKYPTLPAGFSGRSDAAEIEIHPSGKFLYASNRGHDSIALFYIDRATGKLTAAGDYSVQGKEPRHFAIDPSGNFLLAENQLSDKIVAFRIDQKTGALTATGDTAEVPSPVCLAFLAVE